MQLNHFVTCHDNVSKNRQAIISILVYNRRWIIIKLKFSYLPLSQAIFNQQASTIRKQLLEKFHGNPIIETMANISLWRGTPNTFNVSIYLIDYLDKNIVLARMWFIINIISGFKLFIFIVIDFKILISYSGCYTFLVRI